MSDIREDLLSCWLDMTANIWSERFMTELSFNEAFVCNILSTHMHEAPETPYVTVKDLCTRTRILKSQMNKTLNDLEKRNLISRERFETDRRLVFVRITEEGEKVYRRQHEQILPVLDRVVDRLGARSEETVVLLRLIIEAVSSAERDADGI